MGKTLDVFDEQALYREVVKVWGEHGAHAEVLRALMVEAAASPGKTVTIPADLAAELAAEHSARTRDAILEIRRREYMPSRDGSPAAPREITPEMMTEAAKRVGFDPVPGRLTRLAGVLNAMLTHGVTPAPVPDRVQRLRDAIEGECDGLAIDEQHARAILAYVDDTDGVKGRLE